MQRLVDAVRNGEADLVIGSRFLGSGSYRAPFARRVGIRLFASVLSAILRVRVTDTTSGFRAAGARRHRASSPAPTRTTTPRSRPSSSRTARGCG